MKRPVRTGFGSPTTQSMLGGAAATLLVGLELGCGNGSAAGVFTLDMGEETDTLTASPPPATLRIDAVVDGGTTTLATATLPATTIDLGLLSEGASAAIRATGFDAAGRAVVFGQSLTVDYGALDGLTIPVFVQRTGALARLKTPSGVPGPRPLLGILGARYLVTTGGDDPAVASSILLYDFARDESLTGPPALTFAPTSMALVGTTALLFDGSGNGTWLDLSTGVTSNATPPEGGSFADVQGGATVVAPDGSAFVVGATRSTGTPTSSVLAVAADGTPSWVTLSAPRFGACATYAAGLGLVVAGGSATAPGVEIVAKGQTSGRAISGYAPDPAIAEAAASLDDANLVLLAGGQTPDGRDPGARVVDLSCAASCTPTLWTAIDPPLAYAALFSATTGSATLVGSELVSGTTHAFALGPGGATAIATKALHDTASAIASPIGVRGSFLVYGGANELESFAP